MTICLKDRAIIRVEGPDARTFLQGLITNDMHKIKEGGVIYAAMLTPTGRFLDDFFIFEREDYFFLTPERDRVDVLLKRLNMFKLRAHVSLTYEDSLGLWVMGNEGLMDPRLQAMGLIDIAPFKDMDGGPYARLRYALGVAQGGVEIPREKGIILEYNFDELHGISWTKGCYAGQELMARTKHVGQLRKRLYGLRSDTLLMPDTKLFLGDKKVGEVRAFEAPYGLALVRIQDLPLDFDGELKTHEGAPVWVQVPAYLGD